MHRFLFLLLLPFSLPLTAQRLTPPKPVVIKFTATWERYHILNANTSQTPTLSTSVNKSPFPPIHLTIAPTLFSQQTTIHLSTPSPLDFAQLELLDFNGRPINMVHKGRINAGDTTFALSVPASLPAGMYLLRLASAGSSIVQKLILEK